MLGSLVVGIPGIEINSRTTVKINMCLCLIVIV